MNPRKTGLHQDKRRSYHLAALKEERAGARSSVCRVAVRVEDGLRFAWTRVKLQGSGHKRPEPFPALLYKDMFECDRKREQTGDCHQPPHSGAKRSCTAGEARRHKGGTLMRDARLGAKCKSPQTEKPGLTEASGFSGKSKVQRRKRNASSGKRIPCPL